MTREWPANFTRDAATLAPPACGYLMRNALCAGGASAGGLLTERVADGVTPQVHYVVLVREAHVDALESADAANAAELTMACAATEPSGLGKLIDPCRSPRPPAAAACWHIVHISAAYHHTSTS